MFLKISWKESRAFLPAMNLSLDCKLLLDDFNGELRHLVRSRDLIGRWIPILDKSWHWGVWWRVTACKIQILCETKIEFKHDLITLYHCCVDDQVNWINCVNFFKQQNTFKKHIFYIHS